MKSIFVFQEKEGVERLDRLSALIVILFTFFLFIFYSFPLIQAIESLIIHNASASVQVISSY